jgi:fructose-bisphosphate aldolase class I
LRRVLSWVIANFFFHSAPPPRNIQAIVDQQVEVAAQILAACLVPIVEPEVDIHRPDKAQAEALLKAVLLESLNKLPADQLVMLKITLPEQADFYVELVKHPKVRRERDSWSALP